MLLSYPDILNNSVVREAVKRAWKDSNPGLTNGHEEGGFILRDSTGHLSVVRWSRGSQNSIIVPPHPNSQINEFDIVATFHTHPNTRSDYLREPSDTDKRAVRDDPDLKANIMQANSLFHKRKSISLYRPDK